jgi:protein-disulfide isomerase/peroxiredoxin/uncharacterized membrane protein
MGKKSKKKQSKGNQPAAKPAATKPSTPPAAPASKAASPAAPSRSADGASLGLVVGIWASLAVAAAVGAYLFWTFVQIEYGPAGFESACNWGEGLNCDQLNTSRFGKLPVPGLGRVPITIFAIAFYGALALLAGRALRGGAIGRAAIRLVAVGSGLGVAYGIYLLWVMKFVEHTYCVFCLTMDAGILVAFVLSALIVRRQGVDGGVEWGRAVGPAVLLGLALFLVGVLVFTGMRSSLTGQQEAALDAGFDPEAPAPTAVVAADTEDPGEPMKLREGYYFVPVRSDDPQRGPKDAKVTVIEYADFECGYCKKLFYSMTELKEKYKDSEDVRFVFKHYPMNPKCNSNVKNTRHRYACEASYAAECARQQGSFWPMHDLMFKNQHKLEVDDLEYYANRVGLDMSQFNRCMKDPAVKRRVMDDADIGYAVDVSATPRTFVNGRYLKGALPASTLEHVIEQELGRREAGERPQPAAPAASVRVRPQDAPGQAAIDYGAPFWIDSFEASVDASGRALSVQGVLPANGSWYDAKVACEAAGKRLCSTYEWVSACQGAAAVDDDSSGSFADDYIEGNQFPYADYYQPRWCRDTEVDQRDAEGKVIKEGQPGNTGGNPRCVTETGVFDLGGNLMEWAGSTEEEAVLLGGDFRSKDKTGCFRPNPTWGPGHKNIRMGFRCCSDAPVEASGTPVVSQAPDTMIGKPMPSFEGTLMDGSAITSDDLKGKVTYLSFFASWCGPCKRELPALRELHAKYESEGFQVISVGVDTEAALSERMARKYGADYPVLLDPDNKILGLFDVKSMPTTYLIGRDGVVIDKLVGWGQTEEKLPKVMEQVEAVL